MRSRAGSPVENTPGLADNRLRWRPRLAAPNDTKDRPTDNFATVPILAQRKRDCPPPRKLFFGLPLAHRPLPWENNGKSGQSLVGLSAGAFVVRLDMMTLALDRD